jgi:hypothetical protein
MDGPYGRLRIANLRLQIYDCGLTTFIANLPSQICNLQSVKDLPCYKGNFDKESVFSEKSEEAAG